MLGLNRLLVAFLLLFLLLPFTTFYVHLISLEPYGCDYIYGQKQGDRRTNTGLQTDRNRAIDGQEQGYTRTKKGYTLTINFMSAYRLLYERNHS